MQNNEPMTNTVTEQLEALFEKPAPSKIEKSCHQKGLAKFDNVQ